MGRLVHRRATATEAIRRTIARINRVPLCRDRDRSTFATKLCITDSFKRVIKKEHAGLVGNVVCTCISLFNADRGRAVAAAAIPFDIARGGEAEVCGKVNSYDFAELMFGGHQQISSLTAADVNEGRSWDHFLWQRRHQFGKRAQALSVPSRSDR